MTTGLRGHRSTLLPFQDSGEQLSAMVMLTLQVCQESCITVTHAHAGHLQGLS